MHVRRTAHKDSVACRNGKMLKSTQNFVKDDWDAAMRRRRGSAFQVEEPSPVEVITGGQGRGVRGDGEAEKETRGSLAHQTAPRVREGGLHMEKQHLQNLSLRCRKNRKKNHTGVKDKGAN